MVTEIGIETDFKSIDHNPFKNGYEIEKIVAMNEPQRLMWLSCIIGGDAANLAYNESISLDFKGAFNVSYFNDSVLEVIQRHEALRAVVSSNGESIIIYKKIPFQVSFQDFSLLTDQDLRIKSFVDEEMQNVFDLQEGPLIRAFVHKLSENHHYFTLVGHHLICDGWSFGIILENISKLYNARIGGLSTKLETAEQLSDYAIEMAAFKNSEEHKEVKAYWLDLYKDGAPVLEFPTDYPRPLNRNYKSNRYDHPIPIELVEKLKKLGSKHGSSLVNTLLSAFETFLFLKTNQTDIIVGMPTAGQAATDKLELVGHCVNLLALRSKFDLEMSFTSYLIKRKRDFFDAYENQKFTLGELVESLDKKADFSRIPMLPIIFNVDMGFDAAVSFSDIDYELISNPRSFETFEIFLNATGSTSSFVLEWSYSIQLFKLETIQQISKEFQMLLEMLTMEPSVSFKALAEKNSLYWNDQLFKWNNTAKQFPKEKSICSVLDASLYMHASKTAISYGKKKLSYTELFHQSVKISKHLIKKGVKVGDVVAIDMNSSPELAIAILGVLKAGATFMILDGDYPIQRNEYILDDSNTKIILVAENKYWNRQPKYLEIVIADTLSIADKDQQEIILPELSGQNFAYVQYESHASGKPVAIKIKHASLINIIKSFESNPGIKENDKILSLASNVAEILVVDLLAALNCGAEIILANIANDSSAQYITDLIREEDITVLSGNLCSWKKLVITNGIAKPNLRIWHFGDQLNIALANQLLNVGDKLFCFYGHLETSFVSAIKEIYKEDEGVNLGFPINNTQIFICDENGNPTPHGKTGEIVIGGEGIAECKSDFNKDSYLQQDFENKVDGKLYRTGDLGRFSSNGDLQFLGRLDQRIKINGVRIDPAEVSAVIAKQNNIQDLIVIPKEDKLGNVYLVAYVILKELTDDNEILIDYWIQEIKLELPEVMIPGSFIILERFPLNANNEIDIAALPKPKIKGGETDNINQLQLENELWINNIWKEVLGLKEIDRNDDFFELGGNSMLAVKMMSEIEKQFGSRFPLSILLKNPTIARLAKRIIAKDEVELWKTIVPLKTNGNKTPVYLIHGAGLNVLLFNSLTKYFDEEQPVYAIQAYGLNGESEIPTTIEEIAAKHIEEILENDAVGPFAIAGYSLGGYIAFEMAKQLKEAGKEIYFLGLIDSYAYNKHRTNSDPYKLIKKLKRQFYKLPYHVKSFFNNPKETINYQFRVLKNKVNSVISPDKLVRQFTAREHEGLVYKTYANAYENYVLEKSDLKINLFSVEKRLYYLDDRKYLGWKDLSNKPLNIYNVPGDHNTFLHAPNDQKFAEILQTSLDRGSN